MGWQHFNISISVTHWQVEEQVNDSTLCALVKILKAWTRIITNGMVDPLQD